MQSLMQITNKIDSIKFDMLKAEAEAKANDENTLGQIEETV